MTTRTVAWALTWEFWRRGTIWLVPLVAGVVIAFTGSLYGSLLLVTGLRYSDLQASLDMAILTFVILPPMVLTVVSCIASRRHYVLPIPSALIAGCTLVNGALAAMCMYWIIAIVLGSLLQANWPLLAPACWAATIYVVLQSLAWQAGRSRGLLLLVAGLFLGVAMPLGVDYLLPHLLHLDGQVRQTGPLVITELILVLALTWVLSYFLAVYGVVRDRRGDTWSLAWLTRMGRWLSEVATRFSTRTIPPDRSPRVFRSPQAAQFWFEWHAKGRMILLMILAVLGGLGAWLGIAQPTPEKIEGALGGLSGILVFLSPFVGLYLGSDAGRFDRGIFSATRPLADGAMASAVLKNVAAVICSCSAVWLLGTVVALELFNALAGEWPQLEPPRVDGVQLFVHTVAAICFGLGIWTVVGLGAALALARSWFVCVAAVGVLPLIVGLIATAKLVTELPPVQFWLATVCWLGTLAAYTVAYQLRVISPKTILTCCGLYVLLCIAVISAATLERQASVPALMLFVLAGVCAVPFAPLAAAPCAMYWNRHR
ncbi:MAG: hypothetical protein ACYC0X_25610 [Pirellulaceae bacterium]